MLENWSRQHESTFVFSQTLGTMYLHTLSHFQDVRRDQKVVFPNSMEK